MEIMNYIKFGANEMNSVTPILVCHWRGVLHWEPLEMILGMKKIHK